MNKDKYYIGIDFGTSNTTIGCIHLNESFLIPLEGNNLVIPSAIFFDNDGPERLFGREAIKEYLNGGRGRLMRSLKSILGSGLIEESTLIANRNVAFKDIIGAFIKEIKTRAEHHINSQIDDVVLGRPVYFVDDDNTKDKLAEQQLKEIAINAGFKNIEFQFEPIAAAFNYEQSIIKEQLALIIDLGGGTSDFTIVRLTPNNNSNNRRSDVLSSNGIHIGGTDFDRLISLNNAMGHFGKNSFIRPKDLIVPNYFFSDLATWHKINSLYNRHTERIIDDIYNNSKSPEKIARLVKIIKNHKGHELAANVEQAKIDLTEKQLAHINLSFIDEDYNIDLSRQNLNNSISASVEDIITTIEHTLTNASVVPSDISAVFLTGGSTALPLIQNKIYEKFPNSNIVKGDMFGSVGLGLAIEAKNKFN